MTDTCDRPIAKAIVHEYRTPFQSICDGNGAFDVAFESVSNSLKLQAEPPGIRIYSQIAETRGADSNDRLKLVVPTSPFAGTVVEVGTGMPIPKADVSLYPDVATSLVTTGCYRDVQWPLRCRTDGSGAFEFPHVPSMIEDVADYAAGIPYEIIIVTPSYLSLCAKYTVRSGVENTGTFAVSRGQSVVVGGSVRNERGEKLKGATVTVVSRMYSGENPGQMGSRAVMTDDEGRFEVSITVYADAGGDGYRRYVCASMERYGPAEVDIGLDPATFPGPHAVILKDGLVISGRVLDDSGKGVPGAKVGFNRADEPLAEQTGVTADSEGRYECGSLGPFNYDVLVSVDPKLKGGWESPIQVKKSIAPPQEKVDFVFVRSREK